MVRNHWALKMDASPRTDGGLQPLVALALRGWAGGSLACAVDARSFDSRPSGVAFGSSLDGGGGFRAGLRAAIHILVYAHLGSVLSTFREKLAQRARCVLRDCRRNVL